MPSASSCLLHVFISHNIHIKRSPNGIKTDGDYFWNIQRIWEGKSTRDGARGRHEAGGAPHPPRGPPIRRLMPFFGRKKAIFWEKSRRRFQSNRSYGSPYIYETVKGQNTRTQKQRDRETDPISEGISPLPCHGGQGPEGKPFSHLGRRSTKKKKGIPLPFSSGSAGTLPWPPSSSPQSSPTTSPPSSPTLPPSMQRCNLSLSRYNLY